MECPECGGDGRMWDGDDFCSEDCPRCNGEGRAEMTDLLQGDDDDE